MDVGICTRGTDLRARLRTGVLGRAACALGHCRGDAGHHPGVYGAVGNHVSANTEADRAVGHGTADRDRRRGRLLSPGLSLSGVPIDPLGATALLVGAVSWAIASVLTRKLPLPASKVMSSAAQMLAGGVFLALIAALLGEFRNFHPSNVSRGAWLSLLYMIIAGSIIAFTAYVCLIHHESPTKVGTYAYVNPVVAVLLGYFLAGEAIDIRVALGTLCVLISVVVITTARV